MVKTHYLPRIKQICQQQLFFFQELLQKSGIIRVELCRENTSTFSDIFNALTTCGEQAVMVESPTYFQAFNPGEADRNIYNLLLSTNLISSCMD